MSGASGKSAPRRSLGFLLSGGQQRSWLRFRDSYRQTPLHQAFAVALVVPDSRAPCRLVGTNLAKAGPDYFRIVDPSFSIVRTAPRRRDCHKRPHPERIIGRRLPYHEFSSGISLMDARLSDANGCSVAPRVLLPQHPADDEVFAWLRLRS